VDKVIELDEENTSLELQMELDFDKDDKFSLPNDWDDEVYPDNGLVDYN